MNKLSSQGIGDSSNFAENSTIKLKLLRSQDEIKILNPELMVKK